MLGTFALILYLLTSTPYVSFPRCTLKRDREEEWTYRFSSSEQEEILNHTREVCSKAQEEDMMGDKVMAAALQMSIPTIECKIPRWKHDLLHGRGFLLLRGAPTESLTPFERAAFFLYIGNKIGDPVTQNKVRFFIICVEPKNVIDACVKIVLV